MRARYILIFVLSLVLTLGITAYESQIDDTSGGGGGGGGGDDPQAAFTMTPGSPINGEPTPVNVEFDASNSEASAGIAEFNWDLQVSTATGQVVNEDYGDGSYSIQLEVVDANGNTDTVTKTLDVNQDGTISEVNYEYQGEEVVYSGYSQDFIYDLQGSFARKGRPPKSGPSLYYGDTTVVNKNSESSYDDSGTDGVANNVDSYFVQDSTNTWGGGELYTAEWGSPNYLLEGRNTQKALVTPPNSQASDDSARCGDGLRNLADESSAETDCPEDYGLPANSYSNSGNNQAATTISDNLDQISPENLNNGDVSHDTNNAMDVTNNFNMVVTEFDGSQTVDWKEGSTTSYTLGMSSWTGRPAYYINGSDQIRAKVPSHTTQSFNINDYTSDFSGTTWEINSQDHTVYDTTSDGTLYSSCSGDNSYSSCSASSSAPSRCTSVDTSSSSEVTEYDYSSRTESETVTVSDVASQYTINDDGSGGKTESNQNVNFDITVEWSETDGGSGSGYYKSCSSTKDDLSSSSARDCIATETCSDQSTKTACDNTVGCTSQTDNGTFTGCTGSVNPSCSYDSNSDDEYYTTSTKSIDSQETSSNVGSISYEQVSWQTPLIFSTTEEDYPGYDEGSSPKNVIFNNNGVDLSSVNTLLEAGETYYSHAVSAPSKDFGNAKSVSASTYNIAESSGDFISVRDNFQTFDIDGSKGYGNGYVAVRHFVNNQGSDSESRSNNFQVVGSSDEFANKEISNTYSSGEILSFFGLVGPQAVQNENYVDETQIENMLANDNFQCPNGDLTCVVDVSLHLDNIENWDSFDPSTGVDIDYSAASTSESLGVCKQFKQYEGTDYNLDEYENVQCTYENFDGVSDNAESVDTYDSHNAGTRWHTMEGPEVDSSAFTSSSSPKVQDDYESKVEYGECVLHGEPVPEGTTANVALAPSDRPADYPGYESGGDSPDEEVCLNIPDSTYHSFGGQWYDLDDRDATEYVRNEMSSSDVRTSNNAEGVQVDYSALDNPFDSSDWQNYWQVHPNQQASGRAFSNPGYVLDNRGGFALEENCHPDEPCSDTTGTIPYYSEFTNENRDDDFDSTQSDWDTVYESYNNRITIGGSEGIGASNTQQAQSNETLDNFDNSEINAENDQWALTPDMSYGVGPDGTPYQSGSCYGAPRVQGSYVSSSQRVFANSFVDAPGFDDTGNWVNPDSTQRSASEGRLSCDLTGDDWGYGYSSGSGGSITCYQGGPSGNCQQYDPDNPHVVVGDIEMKNSPGVYGDACGDDPGEYLISEYNTEDFDSNGEFNYACTDSKNDCVLDGQIYSEGETEDVGAVNPGQEEGGWSTDEEVCLNIDKSTTGGSWYDVDEWRTTEYIRNKMDAAGISDVTDNNGPDEYEVDESEVQGLLESDEWIQYWRVHKNQEAVTETDNVPQPDWFTFQPNTVAVPNELIDNRGGFALERRCTIDGVQDECQDITDPVDDRFWADFTHAARSDDYDSSGSADVQKTVYHNRMTVGGDFGVGASNSQDEETNIFLPDPFYKSEVRPEFNQFAYTRELDKGIGPFGNIYEPGACYGQSRIQGDNRTKQDRVFANSFLDGSQDVTGDGENDGNWVDPDTTQLSATQGSLSCDLTGADWGYGYNTGSGLNCVSGSCRTSIGNNGFADDNPMSVEGDVSFDLAYTTDPEGNQPLSDNNGYNPEACGDDYSEYLIREHSSYEYGEEFQPNLNRDNVFGCAPDPNHCVYDGQVYHEGQVTDIGSYGNGEEAGEDLDDPEICMNLNDNIPGGTWYDIDNSWFREEIFKQHLISEHGTSSVEASNRWDDVRYFRDTRYWGENEEGTMVEADFREGFDINNDLATFGVVGGNVDWINPDTDNLYTPEGYATQYYCYTNTSQSSDLGGSYQLCDDTGSTPYPDEGSNAQTATPPTTNNWFNAGNFTFNNNVDEGSEQDNNNGVPEVPGVNNKITESSNQFEPSAETEANWPRMWGSSFEFTDLYTSTPGPEQWALTPDLTWLVSNDASVYRPGNCYVRPGGSRSSIRDDSVNKTERVFGNSFGDLQQVNGRMRGIWIDPDQEDNWSNLTFNCDITGPDKGLGFDQNPAVGAGDENDWSYVDRNGVQVGKTDDSHPYVLGNDIAWSVREGKNTGSWEQEPPVCGDDHKEFLIEEQGESPNSVETTGRWACGTDYEQCVSRTDGSYAIYDHGDYLNTKEDGEDVGRLKQDDEVCDLRLGESTDDIHGTWYDQDYSERYCRDNGLYGSVGVQWIGQSYISNHPLTVVQGVDDSWNDYMGDYSRESLKSDSLAAELNNTHTPVPTGTNSDRVGVPNGSMSDYGFCGGDDESEYIIFQDSETDLVDSDQSVYGVSQSPGACVLDNSQLQNIDSSDLNYPGKSPSQLQDERMLYDEGDTLTFESANTERTIACYDGRWWSGWPIVFLEDTATVNLGDTGYTSFRVINPQSSEKTFDLLINPKGSMDTIETIEQTTTFESSGNDQMTVSVEGESTKTFRLEIRANKVFNTTGSSGGVEVYAESQDGSLDGTDQVNIAVDDGSTSSTGQSRTIPGLTFIQLAVIAAISSLIFFKN